MSEAVSDEMVEIAAKAMYDARNRTVNRPEWASASEGARGEYMTDARAALEAAAPLMAAGERERCAKIVDHLSRTSWDEAEYRGLVCAAADIRSDNGGETG